MDAVTDAAHLYEVERRDRFAERPGFRITELQISPTQQGPWHYHNDVQDTFYILEGRVRLHLQGPQEEVDLRSHASEVHRAVALACCEVTKIFS
jgi:quercetin dioxygenase-like cupin family protein